MPIPMAEVAYTDDAAIVDKKQRENLSFEGSEISTPNIDLAERKIHPYMGKTSADGKARILIIGDRYLAFTNINT